MVDFHSWDVKLYGWPSDNCISIFGCPATFVVVPGARITKILNAALNTINQEHKLYQAIVSMLIYTIAEL